MVGGEPRGPSAAARRDRARPWWGDRPLRRRGLPRRRRARHHGLPAGPVDRGRRGDRARAVRDRRHRSSQRGGSGSSPRPSSLARSPSPRTPRTWPMPSARTSPCRSARRSPTSRSSTRRPRWCTSCNRGTSTRRSPTGTRTCPWTRRRRSPTRSARARRSWSTTRRSTSGATRTSPRTPSRPGSRPPRRSRSGRTVRCRARSASAGHDRSRRTPRSGPDSTRSPTSPRARWPGRAVGHPRRVHRPGPRPDGLDRDTRGQPRCGRALRAGRARSRLRRRLVRHHPARRRADRRRGR